MKLSPPSAFSKAPRATWLRISPSRSAFGSGSSIGAGFVSLEIRRYSRLALIRFRSLTTQTKSVNDFVVTLDVCLLQVVEQTPALRDHLQQSAPRMIILLMSFEMLGEFVDALTEQRDLHRRRKIGRASCRERV